MASDRLGKILENYFTRAGLHQKLRESKILEAWEGTVGKAIGEMTQPVRVRNRILQVKVANSVWMHELQFHKDLIIKKLNECMGDTAIRDLWFFIGERDGGKRAPGEKREKKEERKTPELSQEEKNRIKKEVSHLRDPEMKEVLLRLFSRGLALEKSRGRNN